MKINDKENYMKIKDSITMNNLNKIRVDKDFLIQKVAMSCGVSDSTINGYIGGIKIPSLPTLISLGDLFNCNLDYLLDRTDNPISIKDLDKLNKNAELNLLFQSIVSLPKEKQQLVIAFVKGLNS